MFLTFKKKVGLISSSDSDTSSDSSCGSHKQVGTRFLKQKKEKKPQSRVYDVKRSSVWDPALSNKIKEGSHQLRAKAKNSRLSITGGLALARDAEFHLNAWQPFVERYKGTCIEKPKDDVKGAWRMVGLEVMLLSLSDLMQRFLRRPQASTRPSPAARSLTLRLDEARSRGRKTDGRRMSSHMTILASPLSIQSAGLFEKAYSFLSNRF